MSRRLLNLLTALSLLLCVAAGVLWGRSRVVGDYFEREYFRHDGLPGLPGKHHLVVVTWFVSADAGDVSVARFTRPMVGGREPEDFVPDGEGWHWKRRPPQKQEVDGDSLLRWVGVSVLIQETGPGKDTFWSVTAPLWLVAMVSAVLPAAKMTARLCRRWKRCPRGGCSRCGYDLRATPERCPECGRVT
jgi:hypothetical protein